MTDDYLGTDLMLNTVNSKPLPLFSPTQKNTLSQNPTKTEKTRIRYKVVHDMLRRKIQKYGISPELCVPYVRTEVWAALLLWHDRFRKGSTLRQYRAAIKFHLVELEDRWDAAEEIDALLAKPNEEVVCIQEAIKQHTSKGQRPYKSRSRGRPSKPNDGDDEEFDIEDDLSETAERFNTVQDTPQEVLNNGKAVGPAAKHKYLSKNHKDQMLAYLKDPDRKEGTKKELCFLIVLCSEAYGLRPSEWANTKLTEQGLEVTNGKNTNGRASGNTRIIPIEVRQMAVFLEEVNPKSTPDIWTLCAKTYFHETGPTLPLLHLLLFRINQICSGIKTENDLDTVTMRKDALERELRYTARSFDAFKPRISLYSGRHQFAANMKNFIKAKGVAKLMGHQSEQTADRNYARKTKGSAAFKNLAKQIKFQKNINITPGKSKGNSDFNSEELEWTPPQP